MMQEKSEVSPRSSGGAPIDARVLSTEDIAWIDDTARANDGLYYAQSAELIKSHEALRTQVSALRQEADTRLASLKASTDAVVELERERRAARQEAETLRKQRDEALYEAKQGVANARVRAVHLVRHERLSKALGMDSGFSADATIDAAVRRIEEAETLRSQLEAEEARLDFLSSWTRGDSGICPPGNHGGESGTWLFFRQDDAKGDSYGLWNDVETEGLTLREAIDAARVAAPREPKNV